MKAGEIYVDLKLNKGKFDKGIEDSKRSIKLFALEALATVYFLDRFVEKSTNAATKFSNLSKASDISASTLRKLGTAIHMLNAEISKEDASGKLAAFSKNLFDLQHGFGGNASGFEKLRNMGRGFAYFEKSTEEVIESIRNSLDGLDDRSANAVLDDLGLSGMLAFFRKTAEEIDGMTSGMVLTDEENRRLEKVDQTIASIAENWTTLQDKIVLQLSPAFEAFAKTFEAFVKSSSTSTPAPKYKSIGEWLSKRGTAGAIWDSFKEGTALFSDIGEIGYYNAAAANEFFIGSAKSIFGADGAANDNMKRAAYAFNRSRNVLSGSNNTAAVNTDSQSSFAFWKSKGFSDAQAAGMVANELRESSGDHKIVGDNGTSFGLFQWHDPRRIARFKNKLGLDIKNASRSQQLEAAYWELKEMGLLDRFSNVKSAYDAAAFISKNFEIPANREKEAMLRGKMAEDVVKNITINTTNHIHGGGDANAVAGMIGSEIKQQFKHANGDLGNGAH